ncbi:MAG: GSCFA domain-containing protein [Flavobacteriales bacterium]
MLEVRQPEFAFSLSHQSTILLIGSCFSDEIGQCLIQNGFKATVNPGGTIFHPLALAHLLEWALDENSQLRSLQREDIWLSWDLSGSFYALSEQELQLKLKQLQKDLYKYISECTHLMVTFGTAWAYKLQQDQVVVANCHKQASSLFNKENSAVAEIVERWHALIEKIVVINPGIQFIFTVSPVRHSKDGLFENNLSKARLFLAIEALTSLKQVYYFPAYELVNDQLRDYSFFKADSVHPNAKATQFVWNFLKQHYTDPNTQKVLKEWEILQTAMKHRVLYPESKAAELHRKNLKKHQEDFFLKNPQFRTILL